MLLVFGGTTEGKRAALALSAAQMRFIYSTKTPVEMPSLRGMQLRSGALDTAALHALCVSLSVRAIVNASHPFAEELHTTVGRVSSELGLPVLRLERRFPARNPGATWLRYVPDFAGAVRALNELGTAPLLAMTGVQSIARLRPWWTKHATFFHVLDRPESLARALTEGVGASQLIARMPAANADELLAEIRFHGIRVMLTKESGRSGQQAVKQQAAQQAGIPLVIIERPALPAHFLPLADEAELLRALSRELRA